jgi:predicted nucleic acid-binding protein
MKATVARQRTEHEGAERRPEAPASRPSSPRGRDPLGLAGIAADRDAGAIPAFESIVVLDLSLLLRALEVYEVERLDFADAYLVASAEMSGVETVAAFDRSIDRVGIALRL